MQPYWRQAGLLASVAVGCSGAPARLAPPSVRPEQAAQAAMAQLDGDRDGRLDDAELLQAPGLAAAKLRYDADQNGWLSADEIEQGVRRWAEGELGAASVSYVVQLDGRPLPDAHVVLTPEPFLGDAAKGAVSERRRGINYLTLTPEDRLPGAPRVPLMQPGLYRVSITHPTANIPSKYNVESTLGVEISHDVLDSGGIVWALKSR